MQTMSSCAAPLLLHCLVLLLLVTSYITAPMLQVVVVEIKNDKFKTDKSVQFLFADVSARPHGIASFTQSNDLVY